MGLERSLQGADHEQRPEVRGRAQVQTGREFQRGHIRGSASQGQSREFTVSLGRRRNRVREARVQEMRLGAMDISNPVREGNESIKYH